MADKSFDLVILGGGTGGYSTALRAASLGLSVGLVEKDKVGGTCLHRGCIPTKALLHVAELMEGIHEAADRWGIKASVEGVDYSATVANREDIVTKNFKGLQSHLKKAKVETFTAGGKLVAPDAVEVEGTGRITATKGVVLATGSVPKSLPGLEIDGQRVISSNHALQLDYVPKSVIVLGAGAVGSEFACFYRAMGAEVTLVEALAQVLPLEDADSGREVGKAMKRKGIDVRVDTKLDDAKVDDDSVTATLVDGKGKKAEVTAELLLVATGRAPVTEGLGYEDVGVTLDRGFVVPGNWGPA
jgi:dihydrolipoamide dehydrogenase